MSAEDAADDAAWSSLVARLDLVLDEVRPSPEAEPFTLWRVRDLNALVDAMGPDDFGPDERLPYWSALWPAALGLAARILEGPALRGPVLELGAGLGLVSLAAARRGLTVTASDYEPEPLTCLRRSAALSGLRLDTVQWDWRELERAPGRFATVLAADVLYEARHVAPVIAALRATLAPGGVALIADPGRPELPRFEAALRTAGFTVERPDRGDVRIVVARLADAETSR